LPWSTTPLVPESSLQIDVPIEAGHLIHAKFPQPVDLVFGDVILTGGDMEQHRQLSGQLEEYPGHPVFAVADHAGQHGLQRRGQKFIVVLLLQKSYIVAHGLVDKFIAGPAVGLPEIAVGYFQESSFSVKGGSDLIFIHRRFSFLAAGYDNSFLGKQRFWRTTASKIRSSRKRYDTT